MRQICLCDRCKRDYITAGYTIRRDMSELYKDECEICSRSGWVYLIGGDQNGRDRGKRNSGICGDS